MDTELAPTGAFRIGMNANNATLVIRGADGTVSGLSADLGRFIAGKLGVAYEAVVYGSAAPFTVSFRKSEWDIILTGKNAVVAELLDFSADLFAVAMQKGRSAAALSQLTQMVNEAKAAGIVQKALEQAGARGVRIVP